MRLAQALQCSVHDAAVVVGLDHLACLREHVMLMDRYCHERESHVVEVLGDHGGHDLEWMANGTVDAAVADH